MDCIMCMDWVCGEFKLLLVGSGFTDRIFVGELSGVGSAGALGRGVVGVVAGVRFRAVIAGLGGGCGGSRDIWGWLWFSYVCIYFFIYSRLNE